MFPCYLWAEELREKHIDVPRMLLLNKEEYKPEDGENSTPSILKCRQQVNFFQEGPLEKNLQTNKENSSM